VAGRTNQLHLRVAALQRARQRLQQHQRRHRRNAHLDQRVCGPQTARGRDRRQRRREHGCGVDAIGGSRSAGGGIHGMDVRVVDHGLLDEGPIAPGPRNSARRGRRGCLPGTRLPIRKQARHSRGSKDIVPISSLRTRQPSDARGSGPPVQRPSPSRWTRYLCTSRQGRLGWTALHLHPTGRAEPAAHANVLGPKLDTTHPLLTLTITAMISGAAGRVAPCVACRSPWSVRRD